MIITRWMVFTVFEWVTVSYTVINAFQKLYGRYIKSPRVHLEE